MSRKGYTALELIIVVLLIGIMVRLVVVTFGPVMDDRKLASAANEVAAALEYARGSSAGNSVQTRVTFDLAGNLFFVERFVPSVSLMGNESSLTQAQVENTSTTITIFPPDPGKRYRIELAKDGRFSGVSILSAVFGAGNSVMFNGLGTPSTGGVVTLGLNSLRYTVTVNSVTGECTTTSS